MAANASWVRFEDTLRPFDEGPYTDDLWSTTLGVELPSPASFFYGAQSASLFCLWLVLLAVLRRDFFRDALKFNVALRPSWLPARFLMMLHYKYIYLTACYSMVLLMAVTAALPGWRTLRFLTAVVTSIYHLVESSVTLSHRDYLMLYNVWGLALLRDEYAEGLALGFCVHFIASSGLAKLLIGGTSWLHPRTMHSILTSYGERGFAEGGPFSPKLNRFAGKSDIFALGDTSFVILFECIVVPLALLIPMRQRVILPAVAAVMVLLHVGIFFVQSGLIGLFFAPNVASYLFGFGAHVYRGSQSWVLALAVCCASVGIVALRGRLLPEDWPLTPLALFGWSGKQWDLLFERFVTGGTRLVLTSAPLQEPVGRTVVAKGIRNAPAAGLGAAHDAWNLCVGETTLQNEILEAIDFEDMAREGWDATGLVRAIETWLRRDQRLIEVHTGTPLVRAFFVEMANGNTIGRVLARGTLPEQEALLTC